MAEELLNINTLNDWYSVSTSQLGSVSGGGCYVYFGSIPAMLHNVYPDVDWDMSKFRQRKESRVFRFWHEADNLVNGIRRIEEKLSIKAVADWYRVSYSQVEKYGGPGMLNYWPGVLYQFYPELDSSMITRTQKKSRQRALKDAVKSIYPLYDILEEYTPGTHGSKVTLDVFVPKINVAFEYQGEHHYLDNMSFYGPTKIQQATDIDKMITCREVYGITVISIPFWWKEGDVDSIIATLAHFRPDLKSSLNVSKGTPLLDMPLGLQDQSDNTEKNLMTSTIYTVS